MMYGPSNPGNSKTQAKLRAFRNQLLSRAKVGEDYAIFHWVRPCARAGLLHHFGRRGANSRSRFKLAFPVDPGFFRNG